MKELMIEATQLNKMLAVHKEHLKTQKNNTTIDFSVTECGKLYVSSVNDETKSYCQMSEDILNVDGKDFNFSADVLEFSKAIEMFGKESVKIDVDGEPYEFDLTSLKIKETFVKPNDKGDFEFVLPKSKNKVSFRLLNGEDEREIRIQQKRTGDKIFNTKAVRLEKLINSVDGETDRVLINTFVKQMNIIDANNLLKFMGDVMPSFDLNIEVIVPSTGNMKKQYLELNGEFFFPSI